jgi:hypothetical protein
MGEAERLIVDGVPARVETLRHHSPGNRVITTAYIKRLHKLLSFQGPLLRWAPPKRRGRPSRALQRLIKRWCACPRLTVERPCFSYPVANCSTSMTRHSSGMSSPGRVLGSLNSLRDGQSIGCPCGMATVLSAAFQQPVADIAHSHKVPCGDLSHLYKTEKHFL